MIHYKLYLALWVMLLYNPEVLASSCQVQPSEYAYRQNSVSAPMSDTNCEKYQLMHAKASVNPMNFVHCVGTQLILADSDLGSEQYSSSDYYVWDAGSSAHQLLFIFPTRVNITTITLHYYSDNIRGLPRLKFYAVPDDFDVWDAPSASYSHVTVSTMQPGEQTDGQRNVTTYFNYNTTRVVMVLSNIVDEFAVSEVDFSLCSDSTLTTALPSNNFSDKSITLDLVYTSSVTVVTVPETIEVNNKSNTKNTDQFKDSTSTNYEEVVTEYSELGIVLPVVIIAAILVTIVLVAVLVLLLLLCYKRNHKPRKNVDQDTTYCTLDRGTKQQMQPHSIDASAELYDHIQLSPFTGQSEPISNTETKSVKIFPSSTISTSVYHSTEKQHESDKGNSSSSYATYAVVDKKKKNKSKTEEPKESQDNIAEGNGHPFNNPVFLKTVETDNQCQQRETLEDMYAVIQKKPKKHEEKEENSPPVPSHTIESLYTAVQKKPK